MTTQQAQAKGEIPRADVLRLAELVTYQEGSVVSRTLLKRASGTVTVFALTKGKVSASTRHRSTRWFTCLRAVRKLQLVVNCCRRSPAKPCCFRQTSRMR